MSKIENYNIDTIYDLKILLEKLYFLQKNKIYIFRGQPSSEFLLLPSSFRPDKIKQLEQGYPAEGYQKWVYSAQVNNTISLYIH